MKRLALQGLQPGQNYTVQVRSTLNGESSEWSQALDFSTVVDTNPPTTVNNLVWQSTGTAFLATWDALDTSGAVAQNLDFDHYDVRVTYNTTSITYSTQANRFEFTLEANISAFGQPRSPLTVAVRTVDTSGNASAWVSSGSTSNPAPGAPTALSATTGIERIGLNWTPPSDADIAYYRVYTASAAAGPYTLAASPRTNSYTYETTSTGMVYFRVFTVDVFGTESTAYASANQIIKVAAVTDSTAPNAPTSVGTVAGFDLARQQAYVDITWTNPTASDLDVVKIRYGQVEGTWSYVSVPAVSGTTQTYRLDVPADSSVRTAVSAQDFSGNASSYVNSANYPVTAASDTSAPSKPANPSVTGGVMSLFVSHDNTKNGGGAIESDTSFYEVHASTTTGFTPSISTQIGTITKGVVTSGSFGVTATKANPTWYVRVVAVDRSGNRSTPSDQVSATVAVVNSNNVEQSIIDSITNAQNSADNSSKVYIQSTTPTGRSQDIWIDTGNGNVAKRWNGTAWVAIPDANIQAAATAAANAQQTANNAAGKDDFTNNPTFDVWPSGQGAPTGWGTTGGNPVRETTLVRTAPTAPRYNVTASGNYFLFQTIPLDNPQYVTVTFDFYLVSGDLSGSGALIRWNNTVPATFDVTVKFADEFPTATTGKWYTVTKTIKRPANFTGTFASLQLYAMHGWTALGTVTAKDMIIDRASIRPATAMEILSYEAPTVASMNAAIATSANGKNKITYSSSDATGTTGYINGDIWYKLSSAQVTGFWIYNGTTWVAQTLNNTVIASLDAAKITTGLLDAQRIAANSISTGQLLVSDLTNILDDPNFIRGAGSTLSRWSTVTGLATNVTFANEATEGFNAVTIVGGTTEHRFKNNTMIPVLAGDSFRLEVRAKSNSLSANSKVRMVLRGATGTYLGNSNEVTLSSLTSSYTVQSADFVIPNITDIKYAEFEFVVPANATGSVSYLGPKLLRRATSSLIVDGSVTALKVGANEIITLAANIKDAIIGTAKIADLAVTNAKIGNAEITDAKIKSLKADKIEANSALVSDITLKDGVDPVTGLASTGKIKSNNYDDVAKTGMQLDKNGLNLYDGYVAARAVELRSSFNLMPATMSSFESRLSYYQSATTGTNVNVGLALDPVFGDQALTLTPGSNALWNLNLGILPRTVVEPGKKYILSIYAHGTVGTENFNLRLMYDDGSFSPLLVDTTLTTTYSRYNAVVTIPSSVSAALVSLGGSNGTGRITIDGVQLEEKVGVLNDPSRWQPPSSTTIDGGQIKTGAIQSSDESSGRPAWLINLNGDAQFASAKIIGALTVGENSTDATSYAQSGNYGLLDSEGKPLGWKINSDGTADFNNITLRGQANLSSARVFGNMTVIAENGKPAATMDIGSGTNATLYGKLSAPPVPTMAPYANNTAPVDAATGTTKFYGPTFNNDATADAFMLEVNYQTVNETSVYGFDTGTDGWVTYSASIPGLQSTNYYSVATSTEWFESGSQSLKLTRTNVANTNTNRFSLVGLNQTVPVAPGSAGQYQLWVKAIVPCTVELYNIDDYSYSGSTVAPGYPGTKVTFAAGELGVLSTSITSNFRPGIKVTSPTGTGGDFPLGTAIAYIDSVQVSIDQKKLATRINRHAINTNTRTAGTWDVLGSEYYGQTPEDLVKGFNWISGSGSASIYEVALKRPSGDLYVRRYTGAFPPTFQSETLLPQSGQYQRYGYSPWVWMGANDIYTSYCYNTDVERNEVRNPTFAASAANWQSGVNTGSNMVWSGSANQTLIVQSNVSSTTSRGASPSLGSALVNKGDYVYARAMMKGTSSKTGTMRARIVWSDGTYTYGDIQEFIDNQTYEEVTVTGVSPVNGTYAIEFYFSRYSGAASWATNEEVGRINDVMVVNNGPRPRKMYLSYKDGTDSEWSWSGTANASASYRTILDGSIIFDRRQRSDLSTLFTKQYGNQLYSDITGFWRGTGDYSSTTPMNMSFAVTRRQDTTIPQNNYGLTWLSWVAPVPSNSTPLPLEFREAAYLPFGGLGYRSGSGSYENYWVYNPSTAKLEMLPTIHGNMGNLSVALTYYSATSNRETVMSPPVQFGYFVRNRLIINGLTSPDIPLTVPTADRPTGIRVYIGANGTTDRTKMQLYTTTSGFPSSVIVESLLNVPRGGTNQYLPGNTATTASTPPPSTSGFATVAGFTASILHSANDFFSVDGNGSGRISGLSFSENGLVLQTLGGTSGRITTNTGGFVLNHDGTGSWPNNTQILDLYSKLADTGWIEVGSSGAPTFSNSWTNYGSSYNTAAYRKIGNKVYLKGMVDLGTANATIFTLPAGFTPMKTEMQPCTLELRATGGASTGTAHTHNLGSIPGRINVGTSGSISTTNASTGWVCFDNVQFWVA